MQVSFGNMPHERAERSLELFAQHVMPRFSATLPAGRQGLP
jgi:hypothetical protein